jgi:hypothetical protein
MSKHPPTYYVTLDRLEPFIGRTVDAELIEEIADALLREPCADAEFGTRDHRPRLDWGLNLRGDTDD